MIYYFSGTGNSERIAQLASRLLNDELSSIIRPKSCNNGSLGIIFPVYAWGIPMVLEDFIAGKLKDLVANYKLDYVYAIMTHGDDMGYADKILKKKLAEIGIDLDASFSLSMPNTYVCLPGFDVDNDELANSKVKTSTERMAAICERITDRVKVTEVTRGALPFTKSYLIRPLFNRFLVTDRYFRTTNTQCTLCGNCVKQCPLSNILIESDRVVWQGDCTGCLRCYHRCPNNAIQFGKFTAGKGQKKGL